MQHSDCRLHPVLHSASTSSYYHPNSLQVLSLRRLQVGGSTHLANVCFSGFDLVSIRSYDMVFDSLGSWAAMGDSFSIRLSIT